MNRSPWHQIAEFLDAQHLDSLGLRLIPQCEIKAGAQVAGRASGQLCAPAIQSIPHGNHGDNNFPASGAVLGGLTS